MEKTQINWGNELAMLEQSAKDIKSMKYNKGIALKDSKGFNGTALGIGIVEYFIQKNSKTSGFLYVPKYNSLNGIVNRLVNLYGEEVLCDVYVNSPVKLEQLMGQHQIDYIDFAGYIDLHYKNLMKDPKLAEAFLNQDINMYLGKLEQELGKTIEQVDKNVGLNVIKENIEKTSFERESNEEKSKTSYVLYNTVEDWKNQQIENLVKGVIKGWYGSGDERRRALGKDYDEVQRIVNQRLNSKNEVTKKVEEYLKREDSKQEEVKIEEIKIESTEILNFSGATVEVESDLNDEGTPLLKSLETLDPQLNKIIEERRVREKISKEQILTQTVKVSEPKVEEIKKEEPNKIENSSQEQKIEQLVSEVLAGKHGSGRERRQALGDLYNIVQARVNQIAISSARHNQFGKLETQIIEQPIVENSTELEVVLPKQERKLNIFKRGWQKFSNRFKKLFLRKNGNKVLALNPGTIVDEVMSK